MTSYHAQSLSSQVKHLLLAVEARRRVAAGPVAAVHALEVVRGRRRLFGIGQITNLVLLLDVVGAARADGARALPGALGEERAVRHVGRPGEGPPPRHQGPLVGRLHRDDEVGAVGHHHVGDLVPRLPDGKI